MQELATKSRRGSGSAALDGNSKELARRLKAYQTPHWAATLWQVVSSVGLYLLLWFLTYQSLTVSYWLTLVLSLPTGGMLLRIFVLQHDLGHGSLFRSKRANDVLGSLFGVLTLIPFHHWRRLHADHHSHFGDLDHRGPGCVTMLTVEEYQQLGPLDRLLYRLRRNPIVIFTIGGLYHFIVQHRYAYDAEASWTKERRGVHLTTLGILAWVIALGSGIGFAELAMVHLPVVFVMSGLGIWLFLVQHGFEATYWKPHEEWNFVDASVHGSSFLDLPKPLQWLTASVGFHHVHHLNPKIPNYRLEACHRENLELQAATRLTLSEGLTKPWLALWHEQRQQMIHFREVSKRCPKPTK